MISLADLLISRYRPQVRSTMVRIDQDAGVPAECLQLGDDHFLSTIGLHADCSMKLSACCPTSTSPQTLAPGQNRTSDRATRHPDEDQSSWESQSHEN